MKPRHLASVIVLVSAGCSSVVMASSLEDIGTAPDASLSPVNV